MTVGPAPKAACCTPCRDDALPEEPAQSQPAGNSDTGIRLETVVIPAGLPVLGTRHPRIPNDGEELRKSAPLASFRMTETTITNTQFKKFVDATDYVTDAERYGWSFVFWSLLPQNTSATQAVAAADWWRKVHGADWRNVAGTGTETFWDPDHPVVHVSWNDAMAFARWAGGRLPTEAEWEHAARGNLGDVPYPWGSREPDDDNFQPCNIWQGHFPANDLALDGYRATAPAKSFEPNGFGLYNMVGNVWEWTCEPYKIPSLRKAVREKLAAMKGYKLLKGGSFLCHRSYCWRYRIPARSGASPDTSLAHQGFRVVFDL